MSIVSPAIRRRDGFTIVELLIVIVVIGVLAAITVVAYNGIQQRAQNAQVVAGVNQYYKALLAYKAVNSSYPTNSSCLGANYPGDYCFAPGEAGVNPTFDSQMAPFISAKPTLATKLLPVGGGKSRGGAIYWSDLRLIYYLDGPNQSCSMSGATATTENGTVTSCLISLP